MLSHALREILELEQPCGLVAKLSGVRDRAPRCSSSQKQAFNLLIQHAGKLILTARQASKGRPTTPSIGTRSRVTSPSCKRASGRLAERYISSATNQLGWREAVFKHPRRKTRHSRRAASLPVPVPAAHSSGWSQQSLKRNE